MQATAITENKIPNPETLLMMMSEPHTADWGFLQTEILTITKNTFVKKMCLQLHQEATAMRSAQIPRSAVHMFGSQGKALKEPVADSRARVDIHRNEAKKTQTPCPSYSFQDPAGELEEARF